MYMSPEVIKNTPGGRLGAMDIWSVGCMVLEFATGKKPWQSAENEWAIMFKCVTCPPCAGPSALKPPLAHVSELPLLQNRWRRDTSAARPGSNFGARHRVHSLLSEPGSS